MVGERNRHQVEVRKARFVAKFSKMSSGNALGALFWKLSMERKDAEFGKTHEADCGTTAGQIQRDVCGNTDLLRVSCHTYSFNFCYFSH